MPRVPRARSILSFPTFGNNGIDVVHYGLDLDVTPTTGNLDAWAVLDILAEKPLTRFALDLHALEVSKVTVNGVPAGFGQANDKLIIAPRRAIPKGMLFRVYITYSGVPDAIQDPTAPDDPTYELGWFKYRNATYVVSEPVGASTFFPANDEPTDKARFTIAVTVPSPYGGVANGVLTVLPHDRQQAPLRLGDAAADDDVARHGARQSL